MSTPVMEPENDRPALPPAPAAAPPQVPVKSPGLAFFLSFLFPGIGQVYNGQPAKGMAFFLGFVASLYASVEINPLPFALFIPFVLLFNMVDAWRSAVLINSRGAGSTAGVEDLGAESPAWGATLIVVGALFLFHNLGWFDLARISRYWPVLLIVTGVVFLYRSVQKRKGTGAGDATSL